MSVAYYLQLRGHQCDVFEADPEQGGMLRYGIPQYRLPKGWMDRELNHVWELGATFKPNMRLGRDFHLGDIIDDYDADLRRHRLLQAERARHPRRVSPRASSTRSRTSTTRRAASRCRA